MLEKIRKIMHNVFAKLLFLMVAVSFAVSVIDTSKTKSYIVASIGKKEISLDDFLKAKQEEIAILKSDQRYLDPQQAQIALNNINNHTITKLIAKNLVTQEIEELGIKISPGVVGEKIHSEVSFYKDGKFDLETYQNLLAANNLSEEMFLIKMSKELAAKYLLNSLVANLPLKKSLSNYFYEYLSEKRSISLIKSDLKKQDFTNISEQTLQNFHKQNSQLFQTPEYRNFDYLLLKAKNLEASIIVSDEELQKEYENNKEEFVLPETRDFHHFLTPDQKTAKKLITALRQNSDSNKVAKSFIDNKVIGEIFTNQSPQSFLSSLDSSLFQLSENEISDIIKSDLGLHVFKILKIHPKQYKSFAQAKAQVLEKLKTTKSELQAYELAKSIEDEIASGANLNDIATRFNLPLVSMNKVSIQNYQDLNLNPEILNIALNTKENEESPLTSINNNTDYTIVKMKAIDTPKLEEFAQVKNKVKELYLAKLRTDIALEISKTLQNNYQKLLSPENLTLNNKLVKDIIEPILSKHQLSIKQASDIVTLSNQEIVRPGLGSNNSLPDNFVAELFNLKIKQASMPEKLEDSKYAFAIINEIIPTTKGDDKIYQQVEKIAQSNYQNEILDQYLEHLKSKYPTQLNMELINRGAEE